MASEPKRIKSFGSNRATVSKKSRREADSRRLSDLMRGGLRIPRPAVVGDGNGNVDASAESGAPNTIYFQYVGAAVDENRWAYVDWAQNDERFIHGTAILIQPSHENPRVMVVVGYDPLRTRFQYSERPEFKPASTTFTHTFNFLTDFQCWESDNSVTFYGNTTGWDVTSGGELKIKKVGFEPFILTSVQTTWGGAWASFPGAGGGVFVYDQDGNLLGSEGAFPVAGEVISINDAEVSTIKIRALRTGSGTGNTIVGYRLVSVIITGEGVNPFEDEECLSSVPMSTVSGTASSSQLPSDVVYLDSSQTLTNKTLTSPVVNTPDINGGTVDDVTTLTVVSTTQATIPIPAMSEAQRDLIASPQAGMWVYNITTNKPNYYNGSAWTEVADSVVPDASDVTYTPSTPPDWTDPDPTTVQEALDDVRSDLAAVEGLVAGGAPDNANYITGVASAGLSAETVIPGLRGSADIAGAAGAGTAEEYDTATTGLTWSPSSPASVDSNTTILSHLYVRSTDTTERFGFRAWSPAGAFDVRCKIEVWNEFIGATDGSGSLCIANAANTSRTLITLGRFGGTNAFNILAYTYAAGAYTQRGSTWTIGANAAYLRITRDASDNVSFWWSSTGNSWQLIATVAFVFTPTQLGYRISSTTANYGFASDWLRADT